VNEEVSAEHELRQQEITDAELRELLERLGQEEMGGSGLSRVGDVVEATGASSQVIGRMLADIRKDDWERRFGLRQEVVEKKVETHGRILSDHERRLTSPGGQTRTDEELYDAMLAERQRRHLPAAILALVVGFIMVIVLISAIGSKNAERNSHYPPEDPRYQGP
jgi:hypothetical protein